MSVERSLDEPDREVRYAAAAVGQHSNWSLVKRKRICVTVSPRSNAAVHLRRTERPQGARLASGETACYPEVSSSISKPPVELSK
jgi:hypothetical protein